MEWIDYYNLLILGHLGLQLLFGLVILYKTCIILKLKQLLSKATPTMILYFCFMATLSSTLVIYTTYAIALWRPDEILPDPTTLYVIGFIPWVLILLNPIFEFCLCIERCLTIAFPYQYLDKSKKLISFLTVVLFGFCLLLNIWLNDLAKIPQFKRPVCSYFTCFTIFMPKKFLNPFKILISSAEGIAAVFLLILIKYKTVPSIYSKGKSRNKAILIVIFTTIIFEFTPNWIDQAFMFFSDDQMIQSYVGPYRTTVSCINIIISIAMYGKVFNKSNKEISTVQISPATISNMMFFKRKSTIY